MIARLFTAYLQYTGFTLGVHAILVADKAEKKRRDMMDEGRQCGDSSAIEAMNLDPDTDRLTYSYYQDFIKSSNFQFLHIIPF